MHMLDEDKCDNLQKDCNNKSPTARYGAVTKAIYGVRDNVTAWLSVLISLQRI